jgi:restriction endonuclease S subunit
MQISELTLGKIATITMGTSPKGETYNNEGIGIPLLNGPTEFGSIYPTCSFSLQIQRGIVKKMI